jgi:hypothetical protein
MAEFEEFKYPIIRSLILKERDSKSCGLWNWRLHVISLTKRWYNDLMGKARRVDFSRGRKALSHVQPI